MTPETLSRYWAGEFLAANAFIALNIVGALLLGMLVGYERSYHGRAAGLRTYGLVCMASCALTVFVGFPSLWYGGANAHVDPDPTRVVQGVVTGIGFLCAGVIMKDGLSIRGLTTAASIWTVSAIGVLLGAGFYAAALLFAVLSTLSMSLLRRLESRLPGQRTLQVALTFREGYLPRLEEVIQNTGARGYRMVRNSLTIDFGKNRQIWRFSVVALDRSRAASLATIAEQLSTAEGVASFTIVPVRN